MVFVSFIYITRMGNYLLTIAKATTSLFTSINILKQNLTTKHLRFCLFIVWRVVVDREVLECPMKKRTMAQHHSTSHHYLIPHTILLYHYINTYLSNYIQRILNVYSTFSTFSPPHATKKLRKKFAKKTRFLRKKMHKKLLVFVEKMLVVMFVVTKRIIQSRHTPYRQRNQHRVNPKQWCSEIEYKRRYHTYS